MHTVQQISWLHQHWLSRQHWPVLLSLGRSQRHVAVCLMLVSDNIIRACILAERNLRSAQHVKGCIIKLTRRRQLSHTLEGKSYQRTCSECSKKCVPGTKDAYRLAGLHMDVNYTTSETWLRDHQQSHVNKSHSRLLVSLTGKGTHRTSGSAHKCIS